MSFSCYLLKIWWHFTHAHYAGLIASTIFRPNKLIRVTSFKITWSHPASHPVQQLREIILSDIKLWNYSHFLTTQNWQNCKRVFLPCYCHEICRVEAVDLEYSNYTFNIITFCEFVKFGAISWNIDNLPITASLKFESENFYAHVTHVNVVIFCTVSFFFFFSTKSILSQFQISLPNLRF